MSYIYSSNFEKDRLDTEKTEAAILARGGQIVASGAKVALAILDEGPAIVIMNGPKAGTQARLLKNGIGRPRDILGSVVPTMTSPCAVEPCDKSETGKVYDLIGGEARLREVMAVILADISRQISEQTASEMTREGATDLTDSLPADLPRAWRDKAACLDALTPWLECGHSSNVGSDWAEVVAFLTKDLGYDVRNKIKVNERRLATHLVLATPGLGKTHSVQALIEALPGTAVVWVFQPTLRKAGEFARDMAGSSRPIRVFRGRGAPVVEGSPDHMCQRHALAAEIAAKGLSVKKTLCGKGDKAGIGACQYIATCAYQAQLRSINEHAGGGVFVMTHASLTLPPPFPDPHLVIIDEDPSANLPRSITVNAEAMTVICDWASTLDEEGESTPSHGRLNEAQDSDFETGESEESPEALLSTFERLQQGLATAAPLREITASIDIAELEAALKMMRKLQRKMHSGIQPAEHDQAVRDVLEASVAPEMTGVQAMLSAILQEVRLFSAGKIDRTVFNGLSICVDEAGLFNSATAHRLERTAIKPSVPMIVLDGTADPILLGRAVRRKMTVWRIDVQRQGEVLQCLSRGFSNASLAPATDYPLSASTIEEREQLWQDLTIVLRREVEKAPKGVLVVSTLAVENEARRRQCCNDLFGESLAWTHFGATRGLNGFTGRQTVVLIGRKQPPAAAVQTLARAYFALDPEPFDPLAIDYIVRRRTLRSKTGQTSSSIIQRHPDKRVNRLLWQMREAEVVQAIDRVRAVRYPCRILILNALDLRRLDDNTNVQVMGVPADLHLSWPELRNGGNRAEIILAKSGGLLPVAPKALAYIAPDVFPSVEAAKKWLNRTDLDKALALHTEYLVRFQVRPIGQRGACWPLIVDRRQFACPVAARSACEAMLGSSMASWDSGLLITTATAPTWVSAAPHPS